MIRRHLIGGLLLNEDSNAGPQMLVFRCSLISYVQRTSIRYLDQKIN